MENKREYLNNYLKKIDEVIDRGEIKADWNSLQYHKVPDWYQKAKFGIFIHWGVFSVPEFGSEWYPRAMYKEGTKEYEHHFKTYGPLSEFGYKDFVPMFRAENYDAAKWADLFEEAGARFVMPVAEHHDGFQMYDSQLSDWCVTKKGPKKDVIGLLKKELTKRNIEFTASSHRVEHYWFMGGMRETESDFQEDMQYGDFYWPSYVEPFTDQNQAYGIEVEELFMQDWLVRCCEFVDNYQPSIMYFDWWIQVEAMRPYLKKFAAYYYNRALEWGKEVTINYKNDAFMFGTGVNDIERGQLSGVSPYFWQNDTSVAKNSWCYTKGNDYKESHEIICDLVDVVSKNGSLLLNVGPKADGTIPQEDASILKEIGKWLKINGEGIYDTTYFKKYGEGPTITKEGHFTDVLRDEFTCKDIRFTYKPGVIYAFVMRWPENGVVDITLLGKKSKVCNSIIKNVSILGESAPCKYRWCEEALTVISNEEHQTKNPICIKIEID